jgi:hypothetical protein
VSVTLVLRTVPAKTVDHAQLILEMYQMPQLEITDLFENVFGEVTPYHWALPDFPNDFNALICRVLDRLTQKMRTPGSLEIGKPKTERNIHKT